MFSLWYKLHIQKINNKKVIHIKKKHQPKELFSNKIKISYKCTFDYLATKIMLEHNREKWFFFYKQGLQ